MAKQNKTQTESVKVNRQITSQTVRLIDQDGKQVGVVSIQDAMRRASNAGLDLVEVSGNANPPVCKIFDYGKFKFQQKKKANEAKKKQHQVTVKEVQLRPNIDTHDYEVKIKAMKKFISEGNKVKVALRFKGREMAHQELGKELLDRVVEDMKDMAKVQSPAKLDGRRMMMMLSPEG